MWGRFANRPYGLAENSRRAKGESRVALRVAEYQRWGWPFASGDVLPEAKPVGQGEA